MRGIVLRVRVVLAPRHRKVLCQALPPDPLRRRQTSRAPKGRQRSSEFLPVSWGSRTFGPAFRSSRPRSGIDETGERLAPIVEGIGESRRRRCQDGPRGRDSSAQGIALGARTVREVWPEGPRYQDHGQKWRRQRDRMHRSLAVGEAAASESGGVLCDKKSTALTLRKLRIYPGFSHLGLHCQVITLSAKQAARPRSYALETYTTQQMTLTKSLKRCRVNLTLRDQED
jgi:hypothetical protein